MHTPPAIDQTIEHEWRVHLPKPLWRAALSQAESLCAPVEQGDVTDLVFGKSGFNSVDDDGWILRIRHASSYYLELKECIDSGVWKETRVSISGPAEVRYILTRIGLTPHLLLSRKRTTFRDGGLSVSFDRIVLLGTFVEIEGNLSTPHSNLGDIVASLQERQREPPYGDLVRSRLAADPAFARRYHQALDAFHF